MYALEHSSPERFGCSQLQAYGRPTFSFHCKSSLVDELVQELNVWTNSEDFPTRNPSILVSPIIESCHGESEMTLEKEGTVFFYQINTPETPC